MTRISNKDIPGLPGYELGNYADEPWFWHGSSAIDGDVTPFKDAPLDSLYLYRVAGSVTVYVKIAHAEADADWVQIARGGGTITGDLTVTGTVTAGDVSIA